MASVAADHAAQIDRDMKKLRASMTGIQIRTAGFKKDHDHLARATARFTVALLEAEALIRVRRGAGSGPARRRKRSGTASDG